MNGASIACEALLLAVANAAHCAGMCGVFAGHAARGGGRGLATYLAGKTATYVTLGALAGAAGAQALAVSRAAQPWLGLLAGVALGLAALRALRPRLVPSAPGVALAGLLSPLLGDLRRSDLPGGAFTLGAVSGALPCGVVGLALLAALATGTPAAAAAYMLAFGVGTWPALALAGWLAGRAADRLAWRAAGGLLLLAAAALTLARSVSALTGPDCPLCP